MASTSNPLATEATSTLLAMARTSNLRATVTTSTTLDMASISAHLATVSTSTTLATVSTSAPLAMVSTSKTLGTVPTSSHLAMASTSAHLDMASTSKLLAMAKTSNSPATESTSAILAMAAISAHLAMALTSAHLATVSTSAILATLALATMQASLSVNLATVPTCMVPVDINSSVSLLATVHAHRQATVSNSTSESFQISPGLTTANTGLSSSVPVDTPTLAKSALPSLATAAEASKPVLHLAMVLAQQVTAATRETKAMVAIRKLQATEATSAPREATVATSAFQAMESVLNLANSSNLATAGSRIRMAPELNTSRRFATPPPKRTPTRGQLATAPVSRFPQNQPARALSTLMTEGRTATTSLRPITTNMLITNGEQMTELKQLCAFLIVCRYLIDLRGVDRSLCMCEIAVKRLK